MKTSRRKFLQKSVLTLAGTAFLSKSLFSCRPKPTDKAVDAVTAKAQEMLGVQLYCVRDEMEKDPLGSLKQLAEMGYKYVEHAWYREHKFYGWEASEFKKILTDLGLKMPSGHTVLGKDHWDPSAQDFTDAWKKTVEDAAFMEQKFVVSPWLDESLRDSYDHLMGFIEVFNKCGELCRKSGMKFGYHNHDFEFSQMMNDKTVFDLIMENIDPDLVTMQLDIGNMYIAGAKAKDIVSRYPGRFDTIHVKDMIKTENPDEPYESTILGQGLVGTREVTDLSRASGGTILFIIEQESYQGKTPMECMKEDLEIMKDWGYYS